MCSHKEVGIVRAPGAVKKQKEVITQLLAQSCWRLEDLCSVLEMEPNQLKALYAEGHSLPDEQFQTIVDYFAILFR